MKTMVYPDRLQIATGFLITIKLNLYFRTHILYYLKHWIAIAFNLIELRWVMFFLISVEIIYILKKKLLLF